MKTNLVGGYVWMEGLKKINIQIKDGKIFDINKKLSYANRTINLNGKVILPGIIDSHVHFRDFLDSYKEDWQSGSKAAVTGGITTVLDMPNNNPPMLLLDDLKNKRKISSEKSLVNYGFYFGSSMDNIDAIQTVKNVAATKVFMNLSTGKMMIEDDYTLLEIWKNSRMVAVHAEGEMVKKAINLTKITGTCLYLCHISSKNEIDYIRNNSIAQRLRKAGKLFVEVTPHHLFLTQKDENNFVKMKPSLKTKEDQKALWQAIDEGIVDTIGTDHAPHTREEKTKDDSPFGVPGVETMLPLLLDAYNKKKISLNKIIDLICKNSVKIFGIKNKGEVKIGNDADLTIIDLNLIKKVNNQKLYTKCGWSPFVDKKLKGWPIMTIVNGNVVFDRGRIFDKVKGKEVKFIMKNKPNLSVEIAGITWQNPVTTASGTYGVDWPSSKNLNEKKLGALTCKTITLEPREGHKPPTMIKVEGGMLNAVGLKNSGVKDFIKNELPKLIHLRGERSSHLVGVNKVFLPLIISIAGKDSKEYIQLAKILDKEKKIDYLELNFSCPNVHTGMAIGTDPYEIKLVTQKIRQVTNKPIIVKLSPNVTDIKACAKAAEDGGADVVSLINTLMGMAINLDQRKPILTNNTGGLSGPAVKPVALRMVHQVYQAVKIPIIAMGGISNAQDALEFIVAGATAVSVGTANYLNPKITQEIVKGIEEYLHNNNIDDINKLRGTLELNTNIIVNHLRGVELLSPRRCVSEQVRLAMAGRGEERKNMTFLEMLRKKQRENNSMVCVGLDTSISKLPEGLAKNSQGVYQFNKAVIDATADLVCAYKPNFAFYEADETLDALKKTVEYAHKKGVPIIVDAKRGDIGNTNEAYAKAIFETFGFDASTVNGYMGHDCIEPFAKYKDKGVIVVVRSSNPGARDIQDIKDVNGKPVYMHMLEKVRDQWNTNGNLLMVAGATYPEELAEIRQAAPDMEFLVPGVGKQGGSVAEVVQNGMNSEGFGMIINSARGIIYASSGKDFAQASRIKTKQLRDEINKHKTAKLVLDLFSKEAIKFGNFTLKSGLKSPIYIDLRPLVSYPDLMEQIAKEMTNLVKNIKFDIMAGVPYTALPITVHMSRILNKPMIYARRETKSYGTGRKIEGVYKKGDRCIIIDDMITDGGSKFENIEPMKKAGMKVKDVVVVLDREQGGGKNLAKKGYKLTSLLKLTDVLEILKEYQKITDEKYQEVMEYLKKTQTSK